MDCAPSVFFLVRIFKLNLESRGMFAELSYFNRILTNINIIMLSVRHMLESKKNRHLKQSKTPAQRYDSSCARLFRTCGDVTSLLWYSIYGRSVEK